MSTPAERIAKFVDEWSKFNDKNEVIYGVHQGVEDREAILTTDDLTALLAENERLRGVAIEAGKHYGTHGNFNEGAQSALFAVAREIEGWT